MEKMVKVLKDMDGNKIVVINNIKFKGRQRIEWNEVEKYLKKYIGMSYIIESTDDMVYIGEDLPDEYAHSNYTTMLKGTNAKAKANAVQGIPEIIEIAINRLHKENFKKKHNKDARFGWYRYDSRFALPIYDKLGKIERYNIFKVILVIRHAEDGKMYLYDIMSIKKETSTLFQS